MQTVPVLGRGTLPRAGSQPLGHLTQVEKVRKLVGMPVAKQTREGPSVGSPGARNESLDPTCPEEAGNDCS